MVPVPGVDLERDEGIRADTSLEKLGKLKPAFVEGGTVTAGNSSPLNDGASMLLLGSEAAAERIGTAPLARVVSRAAHGVDPDVFGIAPVEASNKALAKAGIDLGRRRRGRAERGLRLPVPRLPEGLARPRSGQGEHERRRDRDRPPLGASGARVVGRAVTELRARGGRYAVATLCIGVGQGLAMVLERV